MGAILLESRQAAEAVAAAPLAVAIFSLDQSVETSRVDDWANKWLVSWLAGWLAS